MTAQEAIEKIKALFVDAAPVAAPSKFAEYVLADGNKVMIDILDVGGKVTMVDPSGVESPVGAGDYTLADGTMISVDDTGTIVSVSNPEQQPAAPSEADVVAQRIAEMQTQLEELKAANANAISKFNAQLASQNEKMTALKDILVAALETPSAKSTEDHKQSFRHTESKEDKINRFLDKVKSFK